MSNDEMMEVELSKEIIELKRGVTKALTSSEILLSKMTWSHPDYEQFRIYGERLKELQDFIGNVPRDYFNYLVTPDVKKVVEDRHAALVKDKQSKFK